jgi:hypothetical protein
MACPSSSSRDFRFYFLGLAKDWRMWAAVALVSMCATPDERFEVEWTVEVHRFLICWVRHEIVALMDTQSSLRLVVDRAIQELENLMRVLRITTLQELMVGSVMGIDVGQRRSTIVGVGEPAGEFPTDIPKRYVSSSEFTTRRV